MENEAYFYRDGKDRSSNLSQDKGRQRSQGLLRKAWQEKLDIGLHPEVELLSDELKAAIILFFSLLDEKQRRLFAGLESAKMGHGGDYKMATLHPLRDFFATSGWSAPVSRIGTLTLVGPPLGFLPSHRDDRFPRSVHEPGSSSRRLYGGHRPGSRQAPPGLVLGFWSPPVLMPSVIFRHLFSGSLSLVSLNLTCHDLLR
jgi:hypothetical protein